MKPKKALRLLLIKSREATKSIYLYKQGSPDAYFWHGKRAGLDYAITLLRAIIREK